MLLIFAPQKYAMRDRESRGKCLTNLPSWIHGVGRAMPNKQVPNDSREIALRRWRVMEIELPDGTRSRHVWGHDAKNGLGRASSPIKDFDRESMTAITRSGSNYRLIGLPGNSRLGKDAWRRWCNENAIAAETDVTDQYLNIEQLSTIELNKITSTVDQ